MAIGKTNAFSGNGGFQVGYINSAGNIQPLSFSGTTASDDGEPLTGLTKKIFNTGKPEPAYSGGGGGISNLYKITSVSGTTYSGVKATAYDATTDTFTYSSTAETITASTAPSVDYLYTVLNGAILGDRLRYEGSIPLASAPNGVMTSNTTTSDGSDWICVDPQTGYEGYDNPWKIFDNSTETKNTLASTAPLIWRSNTPRLVKRIEIYCNRWNEEQLLNIAGSNDGSTWNTIGTIQITYDTTCKKWSTWTFSENSTAYTYHRLLPPTDWDSLAELKAYSTLE